MPWSREDLTRLVELEAHQQEVDPRLALAVAEQESAFDPLARSPKGATGIMQLMPNTAKQLGVNINDPADNIRGGVTYLKQQLVAFGGDTSKALAAYNAGPDVVKAYGKVPPYKETQGYVSRIMGKLGPSSAEASTPQAQPQAAGMSRLQELEAHLARLEGQAAPQAPQAASAPPPVSQTAPTAQAPPGASQGPQTPETSWTPGMRFQALPSIQHLEPADRAQKTKLFASLDPKSQEEFLRSEEPPSDLTVDIEKPSTPAAGAVPAPRTEAERQTRVQEELRQWEQQAGRPWREGDPRMPSEKRLARPDEAPVTEGITKPSTMIPLLMPGAGLKLAAGPIKALPSLLQRGARPVVEGLSQTAGWTAGRTAETGQVPSPGEIGTEAALNVAAGGVLETLGATGQAILRRSQAGKAIAAADEATTAAHAKWQADTQAAEEAAKSQQKDLYDTAVIKAKASQREYEMASRARQQKIDAGRQEYDEAVRAQQADDLAKEQTRQQTIAQRQQEYQDAVRAQQADDLAREQARQQTITGRQQEYQHAVTGQAQALTHARAVPGRYTPETPSWVQYEKFGDAATDAVVDLTPAKAALAEVRASRGVLPDGTARPFPLAVESIAAQLEKATGDTSFKTIREELRRLGPLTRSQDGNVRGAAKQLYGIYADVLEASPLANDLLKNANATFRKEMAVQDVAEWLTPGRGIVRIDNQGRETINVGALMTRLEKTVADDSLFRRSFAPDELDALRADFRQLAGTPTMPRQAPRAPAPLVPGTPPAPPRDPAPVVPGRPPAPPREPAPVALPADVPVKQVPLPAEEGATGIWPTLQTPAQPAPVTPRDKLGERPKVFKGLTKIAARDYLSTLIGVRPGLVAGSRLLWRGGQQLRYGLARAMLNVESRPQVMGALRELRGQVGPQLYGAMVQGLSAEERKALLRDTRETREKRR